MLIIIEAPGKLKKIREYSGAKVFATVGHYRDLPDRELGVDIEKLEPVFVPKEAKSGLIKDLIAQAKGQDVIVATDPDREGYAIGMMVWRDIEKVAKSVKRAEFREISAKVVKAEIARAVPMENTNLHLYDAFLGRRVGDRLIGYLLSPVASRALGRDLSPWSVGRVQSPAVRLIGEREREINAFTSSKYYLVGIECEKEGVKFIAWHAAGKIEVKTDAEALAKMVSQENSALVMSVERKNRQEMPKPPFETASLQMAASSQLAIAPERTMKLAQDLYAAGLISYHRTDSVRLAPEFIQGLRQQISSDCGANYLPAQPHEYRSKDSQADAHEGIRPTKVHALTACTSVVSKESLSQEHLKLYELIARRAMASQMAAAVFDTTAATLECAGEQFKAKGRVMLFDGFRKLWAAEEETSDAKPKDDPTEADQKMPDLKLGETVVKTGEKLDEKTTKAPPRYTEASLVDKLKKLGIGRPSTYATILKGIRERHYVEIKARKIYLTERGGKLLVWLENTAGWIIDYEMTRKLEEYLDKVEAGQGSWKLLMERILVRIKESGGSTTQRPPQARDGSGQPAMSEKQLAVINKYGDDAIRKAVASGDTVACRKWLDQYFAGLKKTPPVKQDSKKPAARRKQADV